MVDQHDRGATARIAHWVLAGAMGTAPNARNACDTIAGVF